MLISSVFLLRKAPLVLRRPGRGANTLWEARPSPTTLLRLELAWHVFFPGKDPLNENDHGTSRNAQSQEFFNLWNAEAKLRTVPIFSKTVQFIANLYVNLQQYRWFFLGFRNISIMTSHPLFHWGDVGYRCQSDLHGRGGRVTADTHDTKCHPKIDVRGGSSTKFMQRFFFRWMKVQCWHGPGWDIFLI